MKGKQSILDQENVKIQFNARVFESQPKDFIDKTARYQEGNTHWCWDVQKMDGYDLLQPKPNSPWWSILPMAVRLEGML